jgi:hypothetical protein
MVGTDGKQCWLSQGMLRIAYDKRSDLWLAAVEERRHGVLLDAMDQFRGLLREIVNVEYRGLRWVYV